MALIDHVYFDPGLTDQFDDATDTLTVGAVQSTNGDNSFYVGTPTATNQIQAESAPGVDPIEVSIVDATPGSDVEAVDIKLAIKQEDLDSAIGGNPLNIGSTIPGGQGSAVRVWYRWANSEGDGVYTNMSLQVTPRVEVAI